MTGRRSIRFARTAVAGASSIFARALALASASALALVLSLALTPAASAQGAATLTPATLNATTQTIALPPFRGTLRDDYYPADARLHFRQGRALVEFSVDARGIPTDVVLVNAEPPREFDDAARLLARNLRYQVPPDWQQAAAAHRFRLGVRFQVIECINFSHCDANAHDPPVDYDAADRTYVVSAQKRVLVLLDQKPVAPTIAPAPTTAPTTAPAPAAAPSRPRGATSAPSEEPVYPPG